MQWNPCKGSTEAILIDVWPEDRISIQSLSKSSTGRNFAKEQGFSVAFQYNPCLNHSIYAQSLLHNHSRTISIQSL